MRPVAVVTGATGGMGRAIVADLARTHDVIAVSRTPDALAELTSSPHCRGWLGDLTDHEFLARSTAGLERLDVLVHAAAVGRHVALDAASPDEWRRQLEANVIAPAELTRLCLPLLRASRGTVIFIGSGASTRPVRGSIVYPATKHALKALADGLRLDESAQGVRVSTVAPGQTDTPMLRSGWSGPYDPERFIRPESVARTVRFVVDAGPDVHLTDVAVRPRVELA